VPGIAQPLGQDVDAGGIDAVVVAYQYAHGLPRKHPDDTGSTMAFAGQRIAMWLR
jgi:hypothetical protein